MPSLRDVDRRSFIQALAATAAMISAPSCFAGPSRRRAMPNIVLIMTDDLGYGDVGFTGATAYATPAIDRIAKQGVILTDCYSAAPVCSPTRVALMTGRYPAREVAGLHEPLTRHPVGLPATPPTLARLLKDAGYRTSLVGKWHLGTDPEYHPLRHGFDEFYGFLGPAVDYVTKRDTEHLQALFHDGETPVVPEGYLTDLLTERAERVIAASGDGRPFFLSLQYNAPHWPWQAPGDAAYPDSVAPQAGGSPATFAAMMRSLDDGVGRVLAALDRQGVSQDTMVIFTSDNGGERFSHMGPFSHGKMTLSEGGIRVATAVRWPAQLPAGSTCAQVAVTMDWTATMYALAGVTPPRPLDGIDLLPALKGTAPVARELCWRITQRRTQRAVRSGDLKLIVDADGTRLHDLDADPGEKADLAATRPEDRTRLEERLAAWEREMLAPIPLEERYR
jgi:arylsulfatase A-like enzyme